MNSIKLYARYAKINSKSIFEYKAWPLQVLASMLTAFWDFIAVAVLYWRFGSLGDWQIGHTLFVFGMGTTSFGLAEWFSRGLDVFPWYIRSGAFDRILLRPRSTILQALGERFQPDRGGRVLVGLGCIIIAAADLGVSWNVKTVGMIIAAIIGGWFLYTGVFAIFATIAFWTIGPVKVVYLFTNHTLQYLKIPFGYFTKSLRHILTFVFPLAAFTYFPVMSISGFSSNAFYGFAALPAGCAFFLISIVFWKYGVRHYHSTGS